MEGDSPSFSASFYYASYLCVCVCVCVRGGRGGWGGCPLRFRSVSHHPPADTTCNFLTFLNVLEGDSDMLSLLHSYVAKHLGSWVLQNDEMGGAKSGLDTTWAAGRPSLQPSAPAPVSQDASSLGRTFPAFARQSQTEVSCSSFNKDIRGT
jgi:hypothetical protein